jgi:phospholipase D1/2
LLATGVCDRVRLFYPDVTEGRRSTNTMVHSKVMVIDDRLLRVGSANLNNRSMGADTECDLAIEASGNAQRRSIAHVRNLLLGEHCGVNAADGASKAEEHGFTLVSTKALGQGNCMASGAHRLLEKVRHSSKKIL